MSIEGQVILRNSRRVSARHPWVYSGEIAAVRGDPSPGAIVDILDGRNRFLARGYYNARPQIALRVLTFRDEPVDDTMWHDRLARAVERRAGLATEPGGACRLVHSEGDLLPGLVVDRYSEYLTIQFLTLGVERRRDMIVGYLKDALSPKGVYERSDVRTREYEGLEMRAGPIDGTVPDAIEIMDGDARVLVDIVHGQKTGFYLDQRVNRGIVAGHARDVRVLDAFCYTGAFAVRCAQAGAREVVAVDISEAATETACRVAEMNGVSGKCRIETGNAFDWLRAAEKAGQQFDLIVLDPPPFSRSKGAVDAALRGYKEINLRAFRLLSPSGKLATFSCSFHVGGELLRDVVAKAASDAHRSARVLAAMTQSPDHPMLLAAVETKYLSGLLLEVD